MIHPIQLAAHLRDRSSLRTNNAAVSIDAGLASELGLYGVLDMLLAYRLLVRDWIRHRPKRADKEKRK